LGRGGGSGKGIVTMRKAVEPIFITRCPSKKMFIVGCGLWRRLVGQAYGVHSCSDGEGAYTQNKFKMKNLECMDGALNMKKVKNITLMSPFFDIGFNPAHLSSARIGSLQVFTQKGERQREIRESWRGGDGAN
jgi:hypothetical protein